MNRVYKVIWSKAKHCYVVTSEIAKGYGKSAGSKGVKALLSGLVALSIAMGGYGLAGAVFVESKNAEDGVYNTPVYTTEEVYTKEETGDKFATKDELNAKANAADVENTYAKTADVANTYVNKTKAEVTFLTVDGDVDAHGNLKVGNGNFKVDGSTGNVTTGSAAIGGALTVDGDTEIDGDLGVTGNLFAGGYTETDAKAALNADGSIKGAEGKFTVGTDGKVTAASGKIGTVDITSDGALTGMKSLGVENINAGGTITGNKLTDGVASLQAGNLNTTGNINAHDINAHDIVATGDISGKAISGTTISGTTITGTSLNTKGGDISGGAITGTSLNTQNGAIIGGAITGTTITATGKISTGGDVVSTGGKVQGTSVSDGTAILSGGSLTDAVNITASGTITGHDVVVNDKLTTKNLEVTDGLKTDHITLGSDGLNQTDINKGNVTSIAYKNVGTVGYMAESIFNEDGSSITVRTNEGGVDSIGNSTVGGKEISQYLGSNAGPDPYGKNVTRRMVRNDDGTFSMVDTAVDGKDKYSIVSQNAEERKVTVTDGTKTLTVTKNLTDGIVSETNDGAGKTVTLTQGMDGTYKVVTSGTSTEEIGGKKIENYNGGLATEITGDETHHVTKNQTITVTGKSSLSAADIENKASSSIWNHVGEGYNTSWKMTDRKISESIVNGTASNKENTTAEGTKRIITSEEGTGTYNQTATSNNISLKNKAEGTSFTKSESLLDGEKTSVTNLNGSSTINQSAESIVNFVKNSKGHTTRTEQSAEDITNIAKDGTITNNANNVLNKGANSVINEVGANQVAVMTDSVKATYGSDTYTTWNGNGITNNAKDKTVATNAKDILNTATGDMTNTVGGKMLNNVTGDMENTVGGDLINTVTGDSSLSATNIKNKASTSITSQIGEDGKVKSEMNAEGISNTAEDGTITNTAQTVNTITGNNTVTSNNGGTTFANKEAKTPFAEGGERGTKDNTKITGNKVETGKVLTDFAEVANNLDVKGSTTLGRDGNTTLTVNSKSTFRDTVKMDKTLAVDGESTFNNKVTITKGGLDVKGVTTTDSLKVTGASEFGGEANFNNNVSMGNDLAVKGETRTGTLHVENGGYVGGDLKVDGNIETHDAVLSADSRQVVTGRQLYQTNERVDRLDNRIKKVGANAAALAALRPGDFNPDDKFSIAAGFGSYRNANAAALGLFYRPNENVLLSLGTSFGDGENMVNAGVSVKFGRGKSMAERRKEMADEVSSMRDEMRSQDERIAELEEMLKKQSELIEKLSKES